MSSLLDLADTQPAGPSGPRRDTAFGYPRDFQNHQFVYLVMSPRAGGLSIGLNLNPDRECNFDCVYCEVDRTRQAPDIRLNINQLTDELRSTLDLVHFGRVAERPYFQRLPREILALRHVTLSGDGEPTLCPQFREVVEAAIHLRAMGPQGGFKLVLITNASGLDREPVIAGLRYFTSQDEIWCKLDGGSSAHLQRVNRPEVPFEQIFQNILTLGRRRSIIIQSLFPSIDGVGPSSEEVENYVTRLEELRTQGAKISGVQIYSATRPMHNDRIGHLPLRTLSKIAQRVRERAGLRADVF